MPANKKTKRNSISKPAIKTETTQSTLSITELNQEVERLKSLADQKTATYELIKAVDLYTQALDLLQKAEHKQPMLVYDVLDRRANCHFLSGDTNAEAVDLQEMFQIIEPFEDSHHKADLYSRKSFATIYLGNLPEAQKLAETAFLFARQAKDRSLEGRALHAVGRVLDGMGDLTQAQTYYEQALALARECGDQTGEARVLFGLSFLFGRLGVLEQAQTCTKQGLEIAYRVGDRVIISSALNMGGLIAIDSAVRRNYYEQALAIIDTPDFIHRQSTLKNNLSLVYNHTGLYKRAIRYAEEALESPRQLQARWGLAVGIDSLARPYFGIGKYKEARRLFLEGLKICQEIGDRVSETFYWIGLGLVAKAEKKTKQAREYLERAVTTLEAHGTIDLATALAWLGSVYLDEGELAKARDCTKRAVAILQTKTNVFTEYPSQEVWWWRYQTLLGDEKASWSALDHARRNLLAGVATLSDNGLRRNNFNKVHINRLIIEEWLHEAKRRNKSITPLSDHLNVAGDIQGQLNRMLDIGVRLNARREAGDLPEFIMDEVVELTGAERACLVLLDAKGKRQPAAFVLPDIKGNHNKNNQANFLKEISPVLEEAFQKQIAILRHHPEGSPAIEQRSILCVPLVASAKLLGVIYTDLSGMYGRFTNEDRDLLSILANQAAVALENTAWSSMLEQRVEERTIKLDAANRALEQRAAELTIVNSVQKGLASKLDFQGIIDLVGDKLQQVFDAQVVSINLYDSKTNTVSFPYGIERGQRYYDPTIKLGSRKGFTEHIIESRQPLLINQDMVKHVVEYGSEPIGSGEFSKSYVGVPVIVGGEVMGVIDLQNLDREHAFSQNDLNLLTTLASSLGVALENARLFDETNLLLAETRRKAIELENINSLGHLLAAQLDIQEIYELVGEKLRQIFDTQVVSIITYDRETNLSNWRYSIEKGIRHYPPPRSPSGFSGHVLKTCQPLMINQDLASAAKIYGSVIIAGNMPKSYLGVPLVIGGEARGLISLQNIDHENAFSEADLRLLTTLSLSMGVALENARLFEETQRRASELSTLTEIGHDISGSLDLNTVLDRITRNAQEMLTQDTTAVFLVEPDGKTMRAIAAVGKVADAALSSVITIGEGIIGGIAHSGQAELINDATKDPRAVHLEGTPVDEEGEKMMVAPLFARDQVIGVMVVWREVNDTPFNQSDLSFLVGLARQAAIAIANARLFSDVQNQKRYSESLVQNSPVAIITVNSAGLVTSWNPAAEKLFGYSKEQVHEQNLDELVVPPENSQGGWDFTSQALSGRSMHTITRLQKQDGSRIDVEILTVPTTITGEENGFIAIYHDLTELKKAEEAIHESERRLADIINFLPDATLVIDSEGRVIAWNRAIEDMTGITAEEMLGKGNYEHALPFYGERRPILVDLVFKPQDELEQKYAQVQRLGSILVGETYVPRLRGGARYLLGTASVLRDSKGNTVGAIEIIRDITDRKVAEEELRKAKEAAEAATQAKSAFLAMMSHEIRTPMNAIIGMSGLLLDTPLNTEQRDFAETVRSSGDALLTIINDILDFSKIEAGKMDLEQQPFDVCECVESALDLMKLKVSEKGLELAYDIASDVPPAIIGDVTRLRQILVNLLSNAVKFTETGEVVVTLSNKSKATSLSQELHFAVRDTGIGIPPDRLNRLFQAFSQVDASTTRKYGGTGLGLAVSKRLVEMMGGKMWVESEGLPGKGSTFNFTILATPSPAVKAHMTVSGEQTELRGRRLLIVDDNATNRRILTLQTQSWGMQPHATASPQEALVWVRQGEHFDLAILDLHMPEMDGIILGESLRSLRGAENLPMILLSSLGGNAGELQTKLFAACLIKPIRTSALFNALHAIFAAQPLEPEKAATARPVLDPEMANHHPLRILLAEDNAVNQKLALRLLSQMGYRADVAANGLEAVQAVERQPYDVILMDVQMPEMDGLEATREICNRLPRNERPFIIAMTANAMQGDRELCLEAGMDDYLPKPIRVEELVTALIKTHPVLKVGKTSPGE